MHAFEIKDVFFSYKKNDDFLQNISFSIPDNQIFGLLGHNGSGKSTVLKLICGLMNLAQGRILFYNKPLPEYSTTDLYEKLSVLIEKPAFYEHLTIYENFRIITQYRHIGKTRIEEVLEIAGLKEFYRMKMNQLSTGMKQRMGIAAALIPDPQVILLDEPTNGLDPEGIIEVRNLLRSLKSDGKTLVVSSHILSEMEKLCDQLIILKNGKSVYTGSLSNLIRNRNEKEIILNAKPKTKVSDMLTLKKIDYRFENENIIIDLEHNKVPELLQELIKINVRIDNVNFSVKTLEDLYISLNY